MEKNSILSSNGRELQLPVGFRFRPTDEELILYYLKPKVHSLPLPASFIPQVDEIFHSHPSHLPGDVEQRRYFFCKRKWDYSKTCRMSRINYISDESGYWKQVGKEKAISVNVAPRTSFVVGTKTTFVLYQGKPHTKTSWFMHEYRLLPSQIFPSASTTEDEEMERISDYDGPMFMKSPSFRDFVRPKDLIDDSVKKGKKGGEMRENKTEAQDHPGYVCTAEVCMREEKKNETPAENKEAGSGKEKRIYKIFSQYYKPSTVSGGVKSLFNHQPKHSKQPN